MIFGINTSSDISKLLYIISRAVRRVKFETILKCHEWYLRQISHTNHAIICLYCYPPKRLVIFTCRYFKLSWDTTALSQSNCRNFSCSSINGKIRIPESGKFLLVESGIQLKEFRIQRITVKELGIQYVESRIHSVESRILDFFRINLLRAFLDFYFPGER